MTAPAPSRLSALAGHLRDVSKPSSAVISVPVDAISPNPQQPRKTFDPKRLDETTASIKANGIVQPLGVTEVSPGKYELVWGERRWRAAKAAGLAHVPAVRKETLSDFDKLMFPMIENIDREDLTPFDEANGIARLVEMSTVQEVADRLNRPKAWVSKRLGIAKAPDFVADFATSGTVGDGEALYELAKLADEDPDKAKDIIANYEPGGHLRAQLKAARKPASEADDDDRDDASPGRGARGGVGGGEPNLAQAGRGGRASGEDWDDDGEGVSHAKPSEDAKPIQVKAVLRRAGQIILVTEDGKLRVDFSAQAKKQLAKMLDD